MSKYKFKSGDRIMISANPVEALDMEHTGKTGVVLGFAHENTTLSEKQRIVYSVRLDDTDYDILFYEADLILMDREEAEEEVTDKTKSVESLMAELAEAEAEVVRLRGIIESRTGQLESIKNLPVASVIRMGETMVIKVGDDLWKWFYIKETGLDFHSHSGTGAVVDEVDYAQVNERDIFIVPADKE